MSSFKRIPTRLRRLLLCGLLALAGLTWAPPLQTPAFLEFR
ncbi:hypothetical protein [Deinococcus apachensis]|nr:hypothetical protein [Deinococcus apachensis]